jgi:hypothetical protein
MKTRPPTKTRRRATLIAVFYYEGGFGRPFAFEPGSARTGAGKAMETTMSELEPADVLAETELVHWSPRRGPLIGSGKPGSGVASQSEASPAVAFGALAVGALAVGALAIGALAIGRLAVGSARIRDLRIGRLVVDELVVRRRG